MHTRVQNGGCVASCLHVHAFADAVESYAQYFRFLFQSKRMECLSMTTGGHSLIFKRFERSANASLGKVQLIAECPTREDFI